MTDISSSKIAMSNPETKIRSILSAIKAKRAYTLELTQEIDPGVVDSYIVRSDKVVLLSQRHSCFEICSIGWFRSLLSGTHPLRSHLHSRFGVTPEMLDNALSVIMTFIEERVRYLKNSVLFFAEEAVIIALGRTNDLKMIDVFGVDDELRECPPTRFLDDGCFYLGTFVPWEISTLFLDSPVKVSSAVFDVGENAGVAGGRYVVILGPGSVIRTDGTDLHYDAKCFAGSIATSSYPPCLIIRPGSDQEWCITDNVNGLAMLPGDGTVRFVARHLIRFQSVVKNIENLSRTIAPNFGRIVVGMYLGAPHMPDLPPAAFTDLKALTHAVNFVFEERDYEKEKETGEKVNVLVHKPIDLVLAAFPASCTLRRLHYERCLRQAIGTEELLSRFTIAHNTQSPKIDITCIMSICLTISRLFRYIYEDRFWPDYYIHGSLYSVSSETDLWNVLLNDYFGDKIYARRWGEVR